MVKCVFTYPYNHLATSLICTFKMITYHVTQSVRGPLGGGVCCEGDTQMGLLGSQQPIKFLSLHTFNFEIASSISELVICSDRT